MDVLLVNSYTFNVDAEASAASASCLPNAGAKKDSYPSSWHPPVSPSCSSHPPRLPLTAIRSGDYYMFEEYSDDGLAELEYPDKKSDEKDDEPGGMTVSKVSFYVVHRLLPT